MAPSDVDLEAVVCTCSLWSIMRSGEHLQQQVSRFWPACPHFVGPANAKSVREGNM